MAAFDRSYITSHQTAVVSLSLTIFPLLDIENITSLKSRLAVTHRVHFLCTICTALRSTDVLLSFCHWWCESSFIHFCTALRSTDVILSFCHWWC